MSRLSLILSSVLLITFLHESTAMFSPIDIINPFNPLNPIYALEKAIELYRKWKEMKIKYGHSTSCTNKNQVDPGLSDLTEHFHKLKLVLMKDILTDLCHKLDVEPKELLDIMDYLGDHHERMTEARGEPGKHAFHINQTEIKTNIKRMHEIFAGENGSIVEAIAEYSTVSDPMCVRAQSSQLLLFELFQLIVDSDQKGMQTIVYHMEQNNKHKKEVAKAKENEYDDSKDRVENTFDVLKDSLMEAAQKIFRCDPNDFKKSSN